MLGAEARNGLAEVGATVFAGAESSDCLAGPKVALQCMDGSRNPL